MAERRVASRLPFAIVAPLRLALLVGLGPIVGAGAQTPPAQVAAPAPPQVNAALLDPTSTEWQRQAPAVFRVRFETTKGEFVIEVTRDWAPVGADRFYNLVRLGFYDDVRFFRVVAQRWAQFGISGVPAVAKVWREQRIRDDAPRRPNRRGYVAFAMAGLNDRTTQVFINLADNAERLDAQGFAPFGRVIVGMDLVVDRLYAGYAESSGGGIRAGQQGPLVDGGNEFVDRTYPLLDRLVRATIIAQP